MPCACPWCGYDYQMISKWSGRVVVALLALVSASAAFSCGSSQAATSVPTITAAEVLSRASAATLQVESFEFALSHPSGTTSLPGGLFLTRADGAVVSPDRLVVNAEANYGRVFVKVSGVVIEDRTYMTNFITGAWSEIPAADSPFAFLDPVGLLVGLLGQVEQAGYADGGQEVGTAVIVGVMPAAPLAALVGIVDESKSVAVRLRIDRTTFLLQDALIEGALQPGDGPKASRKVEFSAYNEPIVIDSPLSS